MKIDSIISAVLTMQGIELSLRSKEIDMGPNGSFCPCAREADQLKEVREYFQQVYLK